MKILDATCGTKAMWYEKNHPFVTYIDIRKGHFFYWNKKKARKATQFKINPDILMDFTNLNFPDCSFDMVIFDPPHFVRKNKEDNKNAMTERYGSLLSENWKQVLQKGINELFRVLRPEGIFIFKWSETDKSIDSVMKLFPYKPILGNKNRFNPRRDKESFWLVFLKYDVNNKLDIN